jgi:hypothetical protein
MTRASLRVAAAAQGSPTTDRAARALKRKAYREEASDIPIEKKVRREAASAADQARSAYGRGGAAPSLRSQVRGLHALLGKERAARRRCEDALGKEHAAHQRCEDALGKERAAHQRCETARAALAVSRADEDAVWECLIDGNMWAPYASDVTRLLEAAWQAAHNSFVPFDRSGTPYVADLDRMAQRRNDYLQTERRIRRQLVRRDIREWAAPLDGPPAMLAEWNSPPTAVWGVSGLSLEVLRQNSLRNRESVELDFALGHAARLCGVHAHRLPVRVDVCEAPESVRAHFDAARGRLGGEEEWVFHGNADDSARTSIFRDGFQVGGQGGIPVRNGAQYGHGVYADTADRRPALHPREQQADTRARAAGESRALIIGNV